MEKRKGCLEFLSEIHLKISHFSPSCSFIVSCVHLLSNIAFHHTEHAQYPHPTSASLKQNTLFPQLQSMHRDRSHPFPVPPPQTRVIIALKQLQKNYTFKYLFVIWHQEQVYHKNMNQPAVCQVFSLPILPLQSPWNLSLNY